MRRGTGVVGIFVCVIGCNTPEPSTPLGPRPPDRVMEAPPAQPPAPPMTPPGVPPIDDPTPDGSSPLAVYAHSATALWKVNPASLEMTWVGDFKLPTGGTIAGITDLAIDKDNVMIAVGYENIYKVDPATAELTFLSSASVGLNALTFVPGPPEAAERLIGAGSFGEILEIDPVTGATKMLGDIGGNWTVSGDLVSVVGLGTLATISEGVTDHLAWLDPIDFHATPIGDTGVNDIWGLGYWHNRVYGFTAWKEFVLIDPKTAETKVIDDAPVEFYGAGVSTVAPLIE